MALVVLLGLGAVTLLDSDAPQPTTTLTATPTATPSGARANVWIELGAGECDDASRDAITYAASASPDRRCGSLDQAWDALSAGQTACIKRGTFDGQLVTGHKRSPTTLRGCEDGVVIQAVSMPDPCPVQPRQGAAYQGASVCAAASHMVLADVTIDTLDTHGISNGVQITGDDVELRNVQFPAKFTSNWARGEGLRWIGGRVGSKGQGTPGQRWLGDGYPLTLSGNDALVDNVTMWPQGSNQTPWTESSNGFHLQYIRVEDSSGNTFRRINFVDGGEAGSGLIFFTGPRASGDQTLEGNYFGSLADGSTSYQVHQSVGTCNWTWRFNTVRRAGAAECSSTGSRWHGNVGRIGCDGKHTRNFQPGAGSCGTDTYTSKLGLGAGGSLAPGSPARRVNGLKGCGDDGLTPDLAGRTRPSGAFCSAGALQYSKR